LRTLQLARVPVFAINAGIMGFLAEAPLAEAGPALRRVLRGHYVIEKRLRILAKLNDKPLVPCLNEVVLHTAQVAKMIHFEVLRDREVIHRVRADGVIAATPTGSTSYNLSVGGPIIDPEVSAFVISPIAPFSLTTRPVVVPSSHALWIRMTDDRPAILVLDGQSEHKFTIRDRLDLARAPHDAQFIRFSSDFYARLHEKHSMKL
jgi:NAD+ kinase